MKIVFRFYPWTQYARLGWRYPDEVGCWALAVERRIAGAVVTRGLLPLWRVRA